MKEDQALRAYFFVNQYISGIHAGIQSLHALSEVHNKYYGTATQEEAMLRDWESNHKTVIVLEGGYQSRLEELLVQFSGINHNYPFASFREEKDALNCAMTAVCIILPEQVFAAKQEYISLNPYSQCMVYTFEDEQVEDSDRELIEILRQFRLK